MTPGISKLSRALQVTACVVCLVIVFAPEARSPSMRWLTFALLAASAGWSAWVDWRHGILSKTPTEVFQGFRSGELAPLRRTALDQFFFYLGLITVVVLLFA